VSAPSRLGRWLGQPLLWFSLASAGIFWLHARFGAGDPRSVVVPSGLGSAREGWKLRQAAEREARALGLWRDDPLALDIARERVAKLRARPPSEPSDAELAAFLERHRDAFDEPERYAFEQRFFDPRRGDPEARSRAALGRLEDGANPGELGDPFRFPAVFEAEPVARVRAVFGAEFAEALARAKPGVWQALRSTDGVHLVRLVRKMPARRVSVADVREELARAYALARAAESERGALREAAGEYRFVEEP